jgi:hypothetical protein
MVLLFIKKESVLNVLCGNYSILLLLLQFIIFIARWLKPNLNILKEFPLALSYFSFLVLMKKICSSSTLISLFLSSSKYDSLLQDNIYFKRMT